MWFQIILIVAMVAIAAYLIRATPTPKHLAVLCGDRRVPLLRRRRLQALGTGRAGHDTTGP